MLEVCLLGTGGMMPLPDRYLTALMTRYNGSSLVIDCGEGTQMAIKSCCWNFKPIDVICFTHFHADHISGLPGLLLTIGNAERTEPITFIGPKGLENVVNSLRVIAPDLPFPIKFIELTKNEEEIKIHGYRIKAFKVNHKITCYGYTINIDRAGKFDPEKAAKNQVPKMYWSKLQKGEVIVDGDITYRQDMILGKPRKGLKITYCTDTRPTQEIIDNAKEADLFICEGMYGEYEKLGNAKKYKHMTMYEAAEIAQKANVRQLWLTHYSPSTVYPENYLKAVKKIFENTHASRDGYYVEMFFEN
ncbi:RNAse Z [Acetitomaculum ruminis DSM 5522]|uniref:Ribonuclease Z n=1 Tax=Acetitomaculum ruminis DSM 5522 TaxID=1120918 RepID=A0A1I0ZAJ8_9FIRM|nr:ribonuclease Z [Acetitomaculum ruminis]SFB21438.1 RNAse Z [Acetitomaculum ruminis DSM 5522]